MAGVAWETMKKGYLFFPSDIPGHFSEKGKEMKHGYYVPISKAFKQHLPKDRPYTKLEAAYSLQLDYDAGRAVTVAGYADLWRWDRKKVKRFLKAMSVVIDYPEDTAKRRNQKGKIMPHIVPHKRNISDIKTPHIRLIDNKQLEGEVDISENETPHKRNISCPTTRDTKILETEYLSAEEPSTCPHQAILDLYHKALPEFPSVRVWSEKRKSFLRARWKSGLKREDGTPINSLEYWKQFFEYIRQSDWLMGKINGRSGKPFRGDIEWLITESNFIKIIEGKYH